LKPPVSGTNAAVRVFQGLQEYSRPQPLQFYPPGEELPSTGAARAHDSVLSRRVFRGGTCAGKISCAEWARKNPRPRCGFRATLPGLEPLSATHEDVRSIGAVESNGGADFGAVGHGTPSPSTNPILQALLTKLGELPPEERAALLRARCEPATESGVVPTQSPTSPPPPVFGGGDVKREACDGVRPLTRDRITLRRPRVHRHPCRDAPPVRRKLRGWENRSPRIIVLRADRRG
jgi:hypothetical protein